MREVGLGLLHGGFLDADRGAAGLPPYRRCRRLGRRRRRRGALRCGLRAARLRLRGARQRLTARLLRGVCAACERRLRRDEIRAVVVDLRLRDVALREQAVIAADRLAGDLRARLRLGDVGVGGWQSPLGSTAAVACAARALAAAACGCCGRRSSMPSARAGRSVVAAAAWASTARARAFAEAELRLSAVGSRRAKTCPVVTLEL